MEGEAKGEREMGKGVLFFKVKSSADSIFAGTKPCTYHHKRLSKHKRTLES